MSIYIYYITIALFQIIVKCIFGYLPNSSFLLNNFKVRLVHQIYDLLMLLMHHSWFFSLAPLNIGI